MLGRGCYVTILQPCANNEPSNQPASPTPVFVPKGLRLELCIWLVPLSFDRRFPRSESSRSTSGSSAEAPLELSNCGARSSMRRSCPARNWSLGQGVVFWSTPFWLEKENRKGHSRHSAVTLDCAERTRTCSTVPSQRLCARQTREGIASCYKAGNIGCGGISKRRPYPRAPAHKREGTYNYRGCLLLQGRIQTENAAFRKGRAGTTLDKMHLVAWVNLKPG